MTARTNKDRSIYVCMHAKSSINIHELYLHTKSALEVAGPRNAVEVDVVVLYVWLVPHFVQTLTGYIVTETESVYQYHYPFSKPRGRACNGDDDEMLTLVMKTGTNKILRLIEPLICHYY